MANKSPHFRRTFAEVFRSRSFLFLGAGLSEPYFLALFDEIVELTGPPIRPHFAFVPEGKVDPEFMRSQYHILCNTYEVRKDNKGEFTDHSKLTKMIEELVNLVKSERARPQSWSVNIKSPSWITSADNSPDFTIVRGVLPRPQDVPGECVAISCGRGLKDASKRGQPMRSGNGSAAIGISPNTQCEWRTDFLVSWGHNDGRYGIIARELNDLAASELNDLEASSQDLRSPNAIYEAFLSFLEYIQDRYKSAHVQLLAAGEQRVFHPWVALCQMAQAYREWSLRRSGTSQTAVRVYVVDPSLIALLQSGALDLTEQLSLERLRLTLEVYDRNELVSVRHYLASRDETLNSIAKRANIRGDPRVSVKPQPTTKPSDGSLLNLGNYRIRDLGIVSGSTLVVDFR